MSLTERRTARYGWRPSLHDDRDLAADLAYEGTLPAAVDLRPHMPPVYDQGQLGSCTANAVAACVERYFMGSGVDLVPSRLWIYRFERILEGTLAQGDVGAFGRDGFKVAHKMGVPPETDMPYDIARFQDPPSVQATGDAPKHKIPNYLAVARTEQAIKAALAYGQPVAFGFSVPPEFEAVSTDGIMAMPPKGFRVLGGHEVTIVGYKVVVGELHAIVRNSWGETWGEHGHCYMPIRFVVSANCSDFRTIHPSKAVA